VVATVTTRGPGRNFALTRFGSQMPRAHIDYPAGGGICHAAAVTELCAAWQVTATDPEWGRTDALVLREVLR
jgi:hypothetical protein